MKINIFTLFPDFFDSVFQTGLLKRAISNSLVELKLIDIKQFSEKGRADSYPFGGGDGMLIIYPALKKALKSVKKPGHLIALSPQGEKWSSKKAKNYAQKYLDISLICGRYEGLDSRFVQEFVDEEISIGDYILNGGETAALVLMESILRFVPGFLGNQKSSQNESFEQGLLEGPSWTKPRDIEGHIIPSVILSGHHEEIKKFRFYASLILTQLKRPDLLKKQAELLIHIPEAEKALGLLANEELKALGLQKKAGQLSLIKGFKS